ncbi:MAG: GSCFA domain-containing protein [Crocinitomicaceae bacterium]|nr:GSCFA domain-containing protein [Crocinitomicaceae bacterium]|tara:strand:- start:284074 stop:285054 length:981 start_codon:yes stop_codon:yes gene_type:complete
MNFRTELSWKAGDCGINHSSKLIFIGSCFADNFGGKFLALKFNVILNPNGIIFHPFPILETISRAIKDQPFSENDLVKRDDAIFSWQHHSQHFGSEKLQFLNSLNEQQKNLRNQLKSADYIFITFGTAWGFEVKSTGKIAANCHKIPSSNFDKKLTSNAEIASSGIEVIQLMQKLNPNIKIFFSVSPVRHIKDGIIENNRSKAELVSATHQIIEATTNTKYIPAFEWLMDDLRDYRFYGKDNVHPSEEAIEYIWEKLSATFFEEETRKAIHQIQEIISAVNHKPFRSESKEHKRFLEKTISKIKTLEAPIQQAFSSELEILKAQIK